MNENTPQTANIVASIAHDLRSPLNAIIGFSRILIKGIDGPLNDMQAADLEAIHNNGKLMLAMVEGLIDLARVEADWHESGQTRLQLDMLLEKLVSLHAKEAHEAGIEVSYESAGGPFEIVMEASMAQKAIDNLIHAAMDLIESGQIEIGTQITEEHTVLKIVGVNPEGLPHQANHALESYRSAGTQREYRIDAIALRLLAAKQLIALHGGTLQVQQASPQQVACLACLPRASL